MAKKRTEEKPREYTRRQLSQFKKQKRRQRIIMITGIVIIAAIIILPVLGWFMTEFLPLHRTVLEVNGDKYTVADYLDYIQIGRGGDPTSDVGTLANYALNNMLQGGVIKQGAEKLGYTVSDEEIEDYLSGLNLPDSQGFKKYFGTQLLGQKLQEEYFEPELPAEAAQAHPLIMLLESEQLAREVRARVVEGEDFTSLAEEYAVDSYSIGDYGYHTREVLNISLYSDVPLDYAFSAEIGVLSQPLYDAEKQKKSGYWLIKIVDRPEPEQVNVQALFVSDNATALDIKARLEAGTASLAEMADQYTQYTPSKESQGNMGVINESESGTYTQAFADYVFNPDSPAGQWSQPIRDEELWTPGTYWLVKVLEREDNRALSDEDRMALVSLAFNDWYIELVSDPDLNVNNNLLTYETRQWVLARAQEKYPPMQVQ